MSDMTTGTAGRVTVALTGAVADDGGNQAGWNQVRWGALGKRLQAVRRRAAARGH